MDIKVKVYDGNKYEAGTKKIKEIDFKNIQSLEVKHISDDDIHSMGFDEVDENKEYMRLTMSDGSASIFRNSHIDVFRI